MCMPAICIYNTYLYVCAGVYVCVCVCGSRAEGAGTPTISYLSIHCCMYVCLEWCKCAIYVCACIPFIK